VAGLADGRSSAHGTHAFKARAGHHLAPQPLTTGRNVFEALGTGFTLVALDAEDDFVQSFEQAARAIGVPLTVIRDVCSDELKRYESRLILVRPDQYVAWHGDTPPRDIRALLAKVTGR
jgi:hypothetical protein